jgi:uncharacterized protein
MKLSLERPGGIHLVRGYSDAGIRIDDRLYTASVVVNAGTLIENWRPRTMAETREHDIRQALELAPEVLLIGTGRRQAFPSPGLLAALHASRVGFEIMDTAAACRTYNVLAGEGRNVAAALIVERG